MQYQQFVLQAPLSRFFTDPACVSFNLHFSSEDCPRRFMNFVHVRLAACVKLAPFLKKTMTLVGLQLVCK